MGCTVEKIVLDSGEESILFQQLSEVYGQAAALETYLELTNNKAYLKLYGKNEQGEVDFKKYTVTPKFKEVEFNTFQDQEDLMGYMSSRVVEELKLLSNTASKTTLAPINLEGLTDDPLVIDRVITNIRKNLKVELADNRLTEEAKELLQLGYDNLPRYLGSDGVLGPLGRKLKAYGIDLRVQKDRTQETEDASEYAEDAEGTASERVYSISMLEHAPANSILGPLKLFLKLLPRVHKNHKYTPNNSTAKPIYEETILGNARPVNFEVVYGKLIGILRGVQTVEQMRAKVKQALPATPALIPLHRALVNETVEGGRTVGSVVGYHPLSTALMSLAKADYKHVSSVEYGSGDIRFLYANSNTLEHKIRKEWAEQILEARKKDTPYNKNQVNAIDKFTKSKYNRIELNKTTRVDQEGKRVKVETPNKIVLAAAAKLFTDNGFGDVTKEDLLTVISMVRENPYLIDKEGNKKSVSGVIAALLNTLPKKVRATSADIMSSSGENRAEGKMIGLLSSAVGARRVDIFSGAFLSGKNVVIHPNNLSSEAQDIVARLTTDKGKTLSMLVEDPMYTDSLLLKIITDKTKDSGMFEMQTLDVLKNNRSGKPGVSYGELSTVDALALRINGFFSPRKNNHFFHAFSPTLGDRGKIINMVLPKINTHTDSDVTKLVRDDNGTIVSEEVINWVAAQTKAELTRIARSKGLRGWKSYSPGDGTGNAHKFNLFYTLNNKVELDNFTDSDADINRKVAEVLPHALQAFSDMVSADMKFLVDKGILQESNGQYTTTFVSSPLITDAIGSSRGRGKSKNKLVATKDIETFIVNNFIYGYEQMMLFTGDPAFYSNKSDAKQMTDMNKRFALPFTPGVKTPVSKSTGMPETSRVLILEEGSQDAEMESVFNTLLGTQEKYTGIELADGIGFVSLQRFEQMFMARGMHSDALIKLISDLKKWKPTNKAIDSPATLSALKSFYFKLLEYDGKAVPFSMKYALFPAIPSLFEQTVDKVDRFPAMAKISRRLREGDIDEIVMQSAVKVGQHNIVTLDTLNEKDMHITIDNDAVRFPQVTPTDTKLKDRAGSQIRKQVLGNYDFTSDLNLGELSTDPIVALQQYNNAISTIVGRGGDAVTNNFIGQDGVNTEVLVEKLLNDVDNNPNNNGAFFRAALTVLDGENTVLPISHPMISSRLDNLINASYRRAVNRFKLPGHSAVQIPSYGMEAYKEDGTLGTASDLNFVRIRTKKGRILPIKEAKDVAKLIQRNRPEDAEEIAKYEMDPAQVRVTPSFFLGTLKKAATKNVHNDMSGINKRAKEFTKYYSEEDKKNAYNLFKKDAIKEAVDTEYRRLKRSVSDHKGNIQIDKFRDSGLDKIVLYRIPTQLKSSAMPAIIMEFLPEHSGNTIQVPAEVVEQAGSDFDIDKVSIEMKDFTINDDGDFQQYEYRNLEGDIEINSIKQAENYIVDFKHAVLSSMSHAVELLYPNNVDTLVELVEKFGATEESIITPFPSLTTQEYFRDSNSVGDSMISVASIAAVMHAMAPHIGAKFIKPVVINGIPVELTNTDNIARTLELEGKLEESKAYGSANKIAYEMFQIQNAALDNANDPLLGKLNLNPFTSDAAILLVAAGHGLEFAMDVVNAPIIKTLTENYSRIQRTMDPKSAMAEAAAQTRRAYGIKSRLYKGLYSLDKFSRAQASKGRTSTEIQDQYIALRAFQDLTSKGKELARFNRLMNVDSKGTPASVPSLIAKIADLSGIRGTKSNLNYNNKTASVLGEYKIKPIQSEVMVDAQKYSKTHLATMEEHSIVEAMSTHKVTSISASNQIQRVLEVAKDKLGFLDERRQLKILNNYYTYLIHNENSHDNVTSTISSRTSSGDFMKLSEMDHPEATATLLNMYRKEINTNPNKTQNLFVENLSTVIEGGRKYVTFNNTVAAGMTGELKEAMMSHFEDLMTGTPTERRLARSLADYAMLYYGYEKSINSYMELLPPDAHINYMGNGDTKPAVSTAEFFREIDPLMNDKTQFSEDADLFVDNYVRNNFEMLGLQTVKLKLGWMNSLLTQTRPPSYVIGVAGKRRVLLAKTGGTYIEMKPKGVPNLAIEYHSREESFFHGATEHIDMVANKASQTPENALTEKRINAFTNHKEMFNHVADVSKTVFKTKEDVQNYVDKIADYVDKNSSFTQKTKDSFRALLNTSVVDGSLGTHNRKVRRGKPANLSKTVNAKVHIFIADLLSTTADFAIEQIKKCNS